MSVREELTEYHASQLICRGVPIHNGHKRPIPHAPAFNFALYCTTSQDRGDETDAAHLHDCMTQMMTMRMLSMSRATRPWETLEQPSYTFFYGQLPGTITLNQWASMASVFPPAIALKDSGVMPRSMPLEKIFDRLQELRAGLEDDDPDLLYKILYRRILRDPDRILNPHKTLDKQITDLIMVLSRPDWIDFANPKNQVVTRFIFESQQENFAAQYQKFFHQLLLSLELEMRIQSTQHKDWAKEKLLQQIPPSIQWNLALARRWRQNVRVEEFGKTPDQSECNDDPVCSSLHGLLGNKTNEWSSPATVQAEEATSQDAEAVRNHDEVAKPPRDHGKPAAKGPGLRAGRHQLGFFCILQRSRCAWGEYT